MAGLSDAEIKVLMTADFSSLDAGSRASAEAIQTLGKIMQENIGSVEGLGAAESALDVLQREHLITNAELAKSFDTLGQAQVDMARKAVLSAAGVEEATAVASAGILSNSRTAYSASALISDALTGQFSRSRREVAALANETGLMSAAMRAAASPAGIATIALAAVGFAAYEAHKAFRELEGALSITGDISGYTTADIDELSIRLDQLGYSAGNSSAALMEVVKSGKFTGDEFFDVARAALAMSDQSGESVDKMISKIAELQKDPVKALQKLNQEMNFLTPTEAEEIRHLIEIGDKAGSAARAIRDLADAEASRDKTFKESDTGFIASIENFFSVRAHILSNVIHHGTLSDPDTLQQQLDKDTTVLNEAIERYKGAFAADGKNSVKIVDDSKLPIGMESQLNDLIKERQDLINQITEATNRQTAAQKANAAQVKATNDIIGASPGSYDALSQKGFDGIDMDGNMRKQLTDLEAAKKISYDKQKGFEAEYWAYVLNKTKTGSEQQIEAWQETQRIQRQIDSEQLHESEKADKKSAHGGADHSDSAAAKADREELEEQERIHSLSLTELKSYWDGKLATYTKGSESYDQALRESASLEKQLEKQKEDADKKQAEQQIALREIDVKSAHDAAVEKYQDGVQQADADYRDGKINALQKLNLELQLVGDMDAADKAYYDKLKALRAGDVVAQAQADEDMRRAHAKLLKEEEKDTITANKETLDDYKKTYEGIANTAATTLTQLITRQTTFKKAMLSIGNDLLSHFIQLEAKKLADSLAARAADATHAAADKATELGQYSTLEASKTSVLLTALATRSAAIATQRVADNIADAATSAASVVRAAGVAGALGTASFAGAPWPIDMGAPAFGAAMAAASLAYAPVASAAGGWERVPYDGMPTELHKDEMVLPAKIADKVRDGAGGGDTHHYHISAIDSRSFETYLKNNPSAMANAMRHARRNGWAMA